MLREYQENKIFNTFLIVIANFIPILLFGVSDFLALKDNKSILQTVGILLIVEIIFFLYWLQRKECMQYWFMVLVTWLLCYICSFLPMQAWPLCIMFLGWVLLFNYRAACIIPVLSIGVMIYDLRGSLNLYLCYLLLGIVVVSLFEEMRQNSKLWISELFFAVFFVIAQGVLLYFAGEVALSVENLAFSAVNLLLSEVLFHIFLIFYKKDILNLHRDFYEVYNNPDREELEKLKKENPVAYKTCIHSAYFCDRLANLMEIPSSPLRCAAYYHELQNCTEFPEEVRRIWDEVDGPVNGYLHKDAILFICAESVVGTILALNLKNGKKASYEKDIEKIFEYLDKKRIGSNSDLSMAEWTLIKDTFREETLYYDFLC